MLTVKLFTVSTLNLKYWKLFPQVPAKSGKFHFDYNGDYATERVLITSGRATLTPDAEGGAGRRFNQLFFRPENGPENGPKKWPELPMQK